MKIAVMVSGGGTNLQAIIDGIANGTITNTEISLVYSNNPNAYAIERAKKAGIPYAVKSPKEFENRDDFNKALLKILQDANPDLLVHVVVGPTTSSSEDPWRFDQDYYDMRDEMNMFYMDGVGYIDYKIIDGVRYELDPEFLAQQGDTSPDRDRG